MREKDKLQPHFIPLFLHDANKSPNMIWAEAHALASALCAETGRVTYDVWVSVCGCLCVGVGVGLCVCGSQCGSVGVLVCVMAC